MEHSEAAKKWGSLIAAVWADENLKKRLMTEPSAVLKEFGIPPPSDAQLKVVENTGNVTYLVLPPKPPGGATELSAEQPQNVAGGFWSLCLAEGGGAFSEYPPWYMPPVPLRPPG